MMKHEKCKQCKYGASFKRQVHINKPLPDGIICVVHNHGKIIENDENEQCDYYIEDNLN